MSFAQERFWFLQNLDPESTAYNITASRHVFVSVDAMTLDSALHALVERHAILRAAFSEVDGAPSLVIREQISLDLETYELGHLPPIEEGGGCGIDHSGALPA